MKNEIMKHERLIFGLSVFAAAGNLLYWILSFTGLYPVVEIVPGYTAWFWSFPLPDFWLFVTSVLLVIAIKIKRDAMATVCGLLTASSLIFLSLNELCFSIYTGMIRMPLAEIGADMALKIFNLSVGAFFIKQFSGVIGRSLAIKN
jgi:hypothetical protein